MLQTYFKVVQTYKHKYIQTCRLLLHNISLIVVLDQYRAMNFYSVCIYIRKNYCFY